MAELLYQDLTEKIIKSYLEVYNLLGNGYSKDIYLAAMEIEMKNQGLEFERNVVNDITYKDVKIGEKTYDFINDGKVLLRIETAERISEFMEYAMLNNLKFTSLEVGLVLNFGRRPEVRRKIFQNGKKFIIINKGVKPYEKRDKR